jgi:hypothetical protein
LIISTVFFLSGCVTSSSGGFCDTARAIRPSQADVLTDGTKRQIVAHNEFGQKMCRWKP